MCLDRVIKTGVFRDILIESEIFLEKDELVIETRDR